MDLVQAVQIGSGGALALAGLWLVIKGRARVSRDEGARPGAWRLLGAGIGALGLGYHLLGWALPPNWVPLKAPVDLWWLVAGVALAAAAGGFVMERNDEQGGGSTAR